MMDHIPQEVMTNILQRLGVKDLVRCRRVSKQWLSKLDSPQFIRNQLIRPSMSTTNSNAALYLQPQAKNTNFLCWKEEYHGSRNKEGGFSSSGPIEYHYEPDQVLFMGACHGLICFTRVHHPHHLVVLNPWAAERKVVSSFLDDEEFQKLIMTKYLKVTR